MKRLKQESNIVQVEDFYEDSEELFTGYLVLKHAGTMNLKDLIVKNQALVTPDILQSLAF